MEFDHNFQKFENKVFLKLVGPIVSNMVRINKKKKHSQHSSVFKVLR